MHYYSGPSGNNNITLASSVPSEPRIFPTGNHVSFYWNQCPLHNWWMFLTNTVLLWMNAHFASTTIFELWVLKVRLLNKHFLNNFLKKEKTSETLCCFFEECKTKSNKGEVLHFNNIFLWQSNSLLVTDTCLPWFWYNQTQETETSEIVLLVDVLNGRKCSFKNALGSFHHLLHWLPVWCRAVSIQDCNTVG